MLNFPGVMKSLLNRLGVVLDEPEPNEPEDNNEDTLTGEEEENNNG